VIVLALSAITSVVWLLQRLLHFVLCPFVKTWPVGSCPEKKRIFTKSLFPLTLPVQLDTYMNILVDNFNANTCKDLMCRSYISVDPYGVVFDCDFNQQLDMTLHRNGSGGMGKKLTIFDFDSADELMDIRIKTAAHCTFLPCLPRRILSSLFTSRHKDDELLSILP
jgi:hypothetical protein